MGMSRRKHIVIPSINSINLLHNVALLDLQGKNNVFLAKNTRDDYEKIGPNNFFLTKNTREDYAKIILLLFYPYRTQEDLRHKGSYWKRYKLALSENKISKESLKVIQNIQGCQHNCSKLKTATDELEKTTVYDAHEDDNQKGRNVDDDNCVDINEIAEMFQHLDGMGVREVDPKQRRLKIIAERYKIPQQHIAHCTEQIQNITDIPQDIAISVNISKDGHNLVETNSSHNNKNGNNPMSCPMIIDIQNDIVLEDLPLNEDHTHSIHGDPFDSIQNLSFRAIIAKYTLDFK